MKTKPKSILSLLCLLALTFFQTGCSLYWDRLLNRDPNEIVGYDAFGTPITQSDRWESFENIRRNEEIARKIKNENR